MIERLVDIIDKHGTVIHTYPVTLQFLAAKDTDYEKKALEAAAHGQLVTDDEIGKLTARIHISRNGPLQPFGDDVASSSETHEGLKQQIREQAYFLWEQDGCPEGRSEEYWARARDQHLRDRAYVLWQQQGSREGDADAHWLRLEEFEAH
jgi:hypothetical protein